MARPISSKKYLALSVAAVLAACGSTRNVSEGGEPTHPKNFALKTEHGAAAIADQFNSCRMCHGETLTGVQGLGPSCATCHEANGFANWQSNCTFCHGSEHLQTFDPAKDMAKAAPATGSHAAHVNGTLLAKGLACEQCHPAVTSLAHVDGTKAVKFGALASADGAAPLTSAALAALARGGFYDGLSWHRVVPDFVAQGGDPRGDGEGGPGWALPDEHGPGRFLRGTLGIATAGPETGGSQIFLCHSAQPHLDGRYTIAGELEAGGEVLDALQVGDAILRARAE